MQQMVQILGSRPSLMAGVSSLYFNGSQDMSLTNTSNPDTYIDMIGSNNNTSHKLIAVYNGAPTPVPEPGIFITGISMIGMTSTGLLYGRRRRRSCAALAA